MEHADGLMRDEAAQRIGIRSGPCAMGGAQAEKEGTDAETRRREQAAHEEVTDMAYEAAGHTQSFAEAIEAEVRGGCCRCPRAQPRAADLPQEPAAQQGPSAQV